MKGPLVSTYWSHLPIYSTEKEGPLVSTYP
jgi:hypothetical protein